MASESEFPEMTQSACGADMVVASLTEWLRITGSWYRLPLFSWCASPDTSQAGQVVHLTPLGGSGHWYGDSLPLNRPAVFVHCQFREIPLFLSAMGCMGQDNTVISKKDLESIQRKTLSANFDYMEFEILVQWFLAFLFDIFCGNSFKVLWHEERLWVSCLAFIPKTCSTWLRITLIH